VLSNAEGSSLSTNQPASRTTHTTIRFAPAEAKFMRLTLTKSEEVYHGTRMGKPFDYEVPWTMREMAVYGFENR